VEDNPADIHLLREALDASGWSHRLHVAEDGVEALNFLHRRGPHADAPRPGVILLDLSTPRMSGGEVLAEIRADPVLADVLVFILSGSPWERETLKTLGITEEHYIVKPNDFAGLVAVVRWIRAFWGKSGGEVGSAGAALP
jgi:CheY-like chemotaxis protein